MHIPVLCRKPLTAVRHYTAAAMNTSKLFQYQDSLPSLPVPPLAQSLRIYKDSIKPFYPLAENDPQFIKYAAIIDKFAASKDAAALQEKLESLAAKERNWLSVYWDNYAYLDYRDPVSPYVSYFYSHKEFNTQISKDQFLKSALLSVRILQFMESIEDQSLQPELIKGNPFCMESFKWMFNNCRVPGESTDLNPTYDPKENRFMVVISNNHLYELQTHDESGKLLSLNNLYHAIKNIHHDSHLSGENKNPIGILTASNRDAWYQNYSKLVSSSPINKSNFETIFKSSFVLCLDDSNPITIEEKSRNCWHGNGTNRYFDKPIQIFVAKNGQSGFLGEHSKMDGTPTLRMNDWLVNQIQSFNPSSENISQSATTTTELPDFRRLDFEISNEISENIKTENQLFQNRVSNLSIKTWQYFGLGKNDIKTFKMSPDSFIQMLIQLAYYKYQGTIRPTYEAASTRKFFKGRTETCRSASLEARKFVEDWQNTSVPMNEKLKSFRNAIKSHSTYVQQASNGNGIDRHLLGLKFQLNKTEKQSTEVDEFFNDPVFAYSQYWYLSTSQLTSENFNGYGWAPVVGEGFGLAYMINKDWLHINITNYKDNAFNLKGEEMAYYLTEAVQELKEALIAERVDAKL